MERDDSTLSNTSTAVPDLSPECRYPLFLKKTQVFSGMPVPEFFLPRSEFIRTIISLFSPFKFDFMVFIC